MGSRREEHTLYCGQNVVENVRNAVGVAYALYDRIRFMLWTWCLRMGDGFHSLHSLIYFPLSLGPHKFFLSFFHFTFPSFVIPNDPLVHCLECEKLAKHMELSRKDSTHIVFTLLKVMDTPYGKRGYDDRSNQCSFGHSRHCGFPSSSPMCLSKAGSRDVGVKRVEKI